MQATAQEVCALLEGQLEGDPGVVVNRISRIEEAGPESICFIANPKYEHYAGSVSAGVLIVKHGLTVENPRIGALIRVEDPYLSFSRLLAYVESQQRKQHQQEARIDPSASIGADFKSGKDCSIGALVVIGHQVSLGDRVQLHPGVILGDGVRIGDDTVVHAGAKILHHCVVGARCNIHPGAVIGGDGFGFAPDKDGVFHKIPQTGNVVLEDEVEVGTNTTIDRATLGSTLIRKGVKLDNLIQIGHNVEIGEHTVMAGMSGVSGSAKIGKNCMIGGQVGIAGHITIADGVKINAQTGVSKSVTKAGVSITGSPAMEFLTHYRLLAGLKRIPEILERLAKIEKGN